MLQDPQISHLNLSVSTIDVIPVKIQTRCYWNHSAHYTGHHLSHTHYQNEFLIQAPMYLHMSHTSLLVCMSIHCSKSHKSTASNKVTSTAAAGFTSTPPIICLLLCTRYSSAGLQLNSQPPDDGSHCHTKHSLEQHYWLQSPFHRKFLCRFRPSSLYCPIVI